MTIYLHPNHLGHQHCLGRQGGGVSSALSGTITSATTQSDINTGGRTIVLTLTGDTFVAAGATFDAQRQSVIDGLVSAQSETNGWNAQRSNIAVSAVVRTSDTVVTITLPALRWVLSNRAGNYNRYNSSICAGD